MTFIKNMKNVVIEWLGDKIIGKTPECEMNLYGTYLPHRLVIKKTVLLTYFYV